jgi:hypothetical protein
MITITLNALAIVSAWREEDKVRRRRFRGFVVLDRLEYCPNAVRILAYKTFLISCRLLDFDPCVQPTIDSMTNRVNNNTILFLAGEVSVHAYRSQRHAS